MASVTGTYSRAFADVVLDRRLDAEQVLKEAQSVAEMVAGSKELREVWEAPSIPPDQKRHLLDAIASRMNLARETRNFIAVLIDHRRIPLLGPIVAQFEQELNQRLGFAEAEVTSIRELSPGERKGLEDQVQQLTGKKVRARYSQDKAILGGVVVKAGSTIYDGSVKGQLERLKVAIASQAS